MCTVSMITGYGQRYPDDYWHTGNWPQFKDLVKEAEKFDVVTSQPDCVDPEKDAWMRRIEERVAALEAAAFRATQR